MTDTLTPQELGALGEDIAAQWLCDHNFTILARNVRLSGIRGELDIIRRIMMLPRLCLSR
ncbi:MAG: YraN family protein [Lawsonella clevelandensis]